jgi:hypothetical protein
MSHAATSSAVELDVMVTAEVPTPHGYVFRAEGGTRLTRARCPEPWRRSRSLALLGLRCPPPDCWHESSSTPACIAKRARTYARTSVG